MGVIWGIPYLLIKVAVADLAPATLVFLRTAIGAALLLPIAALRGELAPLRRLLGPLLGYTVVEIAVPWVLLADAERRLSSSVTGLLIAAVPFVGALLAMATRSTHRLDAPRLLGLAIGFAGVAALVGLDLELGDAGAVAEVGLVTVGYATGSMLIARRLSGVPASGVVAASLALTAVAYAPVGIAQLPRATPTLPVGAAVVILGVVCTAVAFLLFFALIAEVGPVRATVVTYVNPAVALALGVALLGEPFTPGMAIGYVLIIAGSVLATSRRRGPPPAPS